MKRAVCFDPDPPVVHSRLREVPPTEREQQLQQQIAKLQQQLHQQKQQGACSAASSSSSGGQFTSCPATESALLDLLADGSLNAARVAHLLAAFPMAERSERDRRHLARQCWEHLLEGSVDESRDISGVVAKMHTLRAHRLYCPREVWKQQCRLDSVELLVQESFHCQRLVGQLLADMFRCLDADGQRAYGAGTKKSEELCKKLDRADLLLVALTLAQANVCLLSLRQQQILEVVHLARHGPCNVLQMHMDQQPRDVVAEGSVSLVNETHHGFPLLFQPLLECEPGWLERLAVLLEAGGNASTTYTVWNSSALHMLCYRKSSKAPRKEEEDRLVDATRLLLRHGAKSILNLTDRNEDAEETVHHRTALIQAASAGRLRVCRVLLEAGADASTVDSNNYSMLDYLFYLKHSYLNIHRGARAGYTCMQLYALVNEFRLQELLTDELKHDCRSCGRCRFLLATCASTNSSSDASESDSESSAASTLSQIAASSTARSLGEAQEETSKDAAAIDADGDLVMEDAPPLVRTNKSPLSLARANRVHPHAAAAAAAAAVDGLVGLGTAG